MDCRMCEGDCSRCFKGRAMSNFDEPRSMEDEARDYLDSLQEDEDQPLETWTPQQIAAWEAFN